MKEKQLGGTRLREAVVADGYAIGGWTMMGSSFAAEVIAGCAGLDYVVVDCQHGPGGFDTMFQTLGSISRLSPTVLVRVPALGTGWIGRSLDAGAEGVIVPMVNTADEARAAARECRYGPDGQRSYGGLRTPPGLSQEPAAVDQRVLCFVMIETVEGLENVEEILRVPGIDGIYVGPADLAISMGVDFNAWGPELEVAFDRIRVACSDAGIISGIHCVTGQQARECASRGYQMVTISSDLGVLRRGFKNEIAIARNSEL